MDIIFLCFCTWFVRLINIMYWVYIFIAIYLQPYCRAIWQVPMEELLKGMS